MSTTFKELGLSDALTTELHRRGLTEPFPIQRDAIPHGLAGRDVLGQAPTGSGKTLAFGLPILSTVGKAGRNQPRALILAPTRELAEQINADLSALTKSVGRKVSAIYGGVGYGPQKAALRSGVDVLVATPGRLEDLIEQGNVQLEKVDLVVVDEADRMADMGFLPAVRRILDQTAPDRQTLLFSATLDGDVAVLSKRYQRHPVKVEVAAVDREAIDAEHHFWKVSRDERVDHTARLVSEMGRTLVFTRTRRGADRLAKQLSRHDVTAVAMHGGRSQSQRQRALKAFSNGRTQALVATDVAARGIHVEGVATVIHYDPPGTHKDYTHRSGRTARAGASGTVVSLVLSDQVREVRRMLRDLDLSASIDQPRFDQLSRPAANETVAPSKKQTGDARTGAVASSSIFVGNLPWKATESDLSDLFSAHGEVERATIIKQKGSGRSRGFGFVEMPAAESKAAVKELQGASLGSRSLKIRFAR